MTNSLAVLLTCHNRKDVTLRCLHALSEQSRIGVDVPVYLVDDGSTDGTADAVRASFPAAVIIQGDGSLFWCRGMELAWRRALEDGHDAYLWLNDDVILDPDALGRLLDTAQATPRASSGPAIVVGSLADPESGTVTYGGYRIASRWHPGRMTRVEPSPTEPVAIDTFNGNVVLVPAEVVSQVGIIDPAFSHATGDVDYGLRARAHGIDCVLAPGTFGTCRRNPPVAPSLRHAFSRKGLPWRDWLTYTRRHGSRYRWPIAFISPYANAAIRSLARRR